MERGRLRVLLAAEYPEARHFLKKIVEDEDGAVIVGQAENGIKAVALARRLRPDVAIVDSYLPHTLGIDALPLSRIGGLDVAQAISEEIPNVRVVLLDGHADKVRPQLNWSGNSAVSFCREERKSCIPFTLSDLYQETVPVNPLVFARVGAHSQAVAGQRVSNLSDKAIFFGALALLGGWFLIMTMALAVAGIYLAVAGGIVLALGLAGKLGYRALREKKAKALSQNKIVP